MRTILYTNPLNQSIELSIKPFLIEKLDGIGMPDVNMQTQKSPFQDGATIIDYLFDTRTISIEGKISGAPKNLTLIDYYRDQLLTVVNPKFGPGTLTITQNGRVLQARTCQPKDIKLGNKLFKDPYQAFLINFECGDPYLYDVTQQQISIITLQNNLTFPVAFPTVFSTYLAGTPVDAFNSGHVDTPVVIDFYGPATNPVVTNTTTGQLVKCNITLLSTDVLRITTERGKENVVLNGTTNKMNTLDSTSTFWYLGQDSNLISFSDATSSVNKQCVVKWYNRYIGM